ncbi:YtpI family protein [Bacillus fonticola]|uniref:YtpI family protein n=1 Tax=Bacillus fonticola TaxID=2728853 RepID=UPI001472B460|nr:YtpI family protein [Bacillus fonticola]
MPFLSIPIIITLVFALFYFVRAFRTKGPMEKIWTRSKARMALGIFVALFGLNTILVDPITVDWIIGSIFVILGGFSTYSGWKMYQHFLPLAREEVTNIPKA